MSDFSRNNFSLTASRFSQLIWAGQESCCCMAAVAVTDMVRNVATAVAGTLVVAAVSVIDAIVDAVVTAKQIADTVQFDFTTEKIVKQHVFAAVGTIA